MMNKRIVSIGLACLMALGLVACAPGTDSNTTTAAQKTTTKASGDDSATKQEATAATGIVAVPGALNILNVTEGQESIFRGVRLTGNRAGSEKFNGRDMSLDDIRFIFEIMEWVEIYIDSDVTSGLKLWVVKHNDDQSVYEKATFSDEMDGFVTQLDLELDDGEGKPFYGSFYLNSEDTTEGAYDLVFTYEDKAVASIYTYFYNEDSLSDKSDAELEKLMDEFKTK